MDAPISKILVARRYRSWQGRPVGAEAVGSMGCGPRSSSAPQIQIYTDEPEPSCVWVTGAGTVSVVNRTGAYHRSEAEPLTVKLGPYEARVLPQQAVRFGPVGRFLGRGLHTLTAGHRSLGVLVEPEGCGLFRAKPGEPLCFQKERPRRLPRWRRFDRRVHRPACRGDDLGLYVDPRTQIARGTTYSLLDVTNLSRRSCTMAGVPGVVAIDHDGTPVARAEAVPLLRPHSRPLGHRAWLPAGGEADFTVTHTEATAAGGCPVAETYGLRITLPGATSAQVAALPMRYCRSSPEGLALRVGRIERASSRLIVRAPSPPGAER